MLAFGIWGLAAVAVAAERPGELLEVALIGLAGAVFLSVWPLRLSPLLALAALAAFSAPLEDVWPLRVFDLGAAHLPLLPDAAGNPATLLLVVALALPSGRRALLHAWRPLALAAALFVAGGLVSAVAAVDRGSAIEAWIVSLVVPAAWGLIVSSAVRDVVEGWTILAGAVAAVLVPMWVAVAAYVLELGVPGSAGALYANKLELVRPHLIQDAVLGNVGHLADLGLAVMPAAIVAVSARVLPRTVRFASAAAALGIVAALVLVLERAPLVLAAATLVFAVAAAVRARATASLVAAATLAVLLVATISAQPVRGYVQSLAPSVSTQPAPASKAPGKHGNAQPTPGGGSSDASTEMRASAISEGLHVYRANLLGVGPGQYQRYDPVHTATHSLPVQVLVEDGPLGLAGYLVLAGILLLLVGRATRDLLQGERGPRLLLRLAAGGGALLFFVEATISGTLLALGVLNLWGLLLWLQAGIAAATRPGRVVEP